MKKRIKKKSLKKTAKELRKDIKNLEIEKGRIKAEKEKLIYEISNLDDLKREKENYKFTENFNKHYGFIKKLVG